MGKTEALRSRALVFPTTKHMLRQNTNQAKHQPPVPKAWASKACHVLECSSRLISNHIWWLSKPNSIFVLECSTEWISNLSKWISKPKCRNVLECSIEWISNHIWWLSKPKCRNAPECSIEWNYPFFREIRHKICILM